LQEEPRAADEAVFAFVLVMEGTAQTEPSVCPHRGRHNVLDQLCAQFAPGDNRHDNAWDFFHLKTGTTATICKEHAQNKTAC